MAPFFPNIKDFHATWLLDKLTTNQVPALRSTARRYYTNVKRSVTHPIHQLLVYKTRFSCTSRALAFLPSSGAASRQHGYGRGQDIKAPDIELDAGFSQLAQGVFNINNTSCTICEKPAHAEIITDMKRS